MAVIDAMFDRDLEGQAEMASALLAEALDWARAEAYEYCYAFFMSSDRPAARFWEAMGFSPAAYWLERQVDPSCSLG